jgi:hypothetical protein
VKSPRRRVHEAQHRSMPFALVLMLFSPLLARATESEGVCQPPEEGEIGAAGVVEGHVLDAHGRPLAGMKVALKLQPRSDDSPWWPTKITESTGSFQFLNVPEGEFSVTATAPTRSERVMMKVVRGQLGLVTVTFPPSASIRGVVRDDLGNPIDHARVSVSSDLARGEVASDKDGRFAIEGLSPGRYLVTASEFLVAARVQREVVAGDTVDLVLQRPHFLVLDVRDDQGNPLKSSSVDGNLGRHSGTHMIEISDDLPHALEVSGEGHGSKLVPLAGLKRGRDGNIHLGTVQLNRGREVSGKVVDARTREPIRGAAVLLRARSLQTEPRDSDGFFNNDEVGDDRYLPVPRTDLEGCFKIRIDPEVRELVFHSQFHRIARAPIPTTPKDWVVPLDRGLELTLKIRGPDGSVRVVVDGPTYRSLRVPVPGEFRVGGMNRGKHWIRIESLSNEHQLYSGTRVEISNRSVQLDVEPRVGPIELRLKVTNEDGRGRLLLLPGKVGLPANDRELSIQEAIAIAPSSDRGSFEALSPGRYTALWIRPELGGFGVANTIIELDSEGAETRTLYLKVPPSDLIRSTRARRISAH